MDERRLYGLPGAEYLQPDAPTVYEQVECDRDDSDRSPITIEEWSVHAPIYHVPSALTIIDDVVERIGECGEVFEEGYDQFESSAKADDVVAAAEALREVLASKVTFLMADQHLRTLTVTFDDAGEPLLDGQPMYVETQGGDDTDA